MAGNSLQFIKLELPKMEQQLKYVADHLQEKDAIEVSLYKEDGQTNYECLYNVLRECIDPCLVLSHGDIIGVIGHKPVAKDGYDIALMCVLTTHNIKKHHKDYFKAAKQFVSALASEYDAVVCEVLDGYEPSIKMLDKFGFALAAEYERKDHKILVKVLRIFHGNDSAK